MPLFVCDKCGSIDNSACGGNYWTRLFDKKSPPEILCCECHQGRWHNQFPKRLFDPQTDDPNNFSYIPSRFEMRK